MHKNATKCNNTLSKWCKNKHGASKIIDMFETYHRAPRKPTKSTPHLEPHLTSSIAMTTRGNGEIFISHWKWGDLRAFHVRSSYLISTLPPFSMYAKHGEEHVASVVQIAKQKLWSGIMPFVTYGKQTQDLLFILDQPLRPYEGVERGAVGRKRWRDSHQRGMGEDENIRSTVYLATFLNPRRVMIRLQRIYNFWCSMLVFTPFAYCFVTLRGTFMHFPELTY
jgi:hypothetical protein